MPSEDAVCPVSPEEHRFHSVPLGEVLRDLGADADNGLSTAEARTRLTRYGVNAIPKVRGGFWKVYIAPILNWLINIYLISSFALLLLAFAFPSEENEIGQATLWLAIVAVNCLVAVYQQFRAQKKLEALEKLSAGESRVIRSGTESKIPPTEIVPGDIVRLDQGDRVPADGRLVASSNLSTNEASLTGESVPAVKDHMLVVQADAPLTDMNNMVFLGTYVSTGTARYVVTKTGCATEIGRIQGELQALNTGDIPLRKKVNRLAKYLGIAAILLMLVTFFWTSILPLILGGTAEPVNPADVAADIAAGISSAMTIMPINIPLLTTIVLLTGVLAMAKKGVIIRDLSAVESLGRVSVICSDKTGTMTRNQMQVRFIWVSDGLYNVTGDGYSPSGSISRVRSVQLLDNVNSSDLTPVTGPPKASPLSKLLICGAIDNDSEVVRKGDSATGEDWKALGDPTDAAVLIAFRRSGIDESAVRARYQTVAEFPFDSSLKRVSKVVKDGSKHVSFVKGATEVLLPRCTMIEESGSAKKLTAAKIAEVQNLTNGFSEKGYRVISLAYRDLPAAQNSQFTREQAEAGLVYLGFVSIVDPPREGVREAVNECHSAGIQVVMITGDSAATAKTIAADLNILSQNSLVVEGSEIQTVSAEDFSRINVFARVNPEHKQVIVERYQDQNKVVAMTGDGVNDVLALAMSDAGIAMGITGTDVAKEAADLIITDDSFASIVTGVHEGRGLFTKIRMMVYFYIAINLFESLIFFGALFLMSSFELFASTWQNLYLVVTTHSFPGLALVFDKVSPRAMEEKPRDSEEILTRPLARFMAINVVLMALGAGLAYWMTLMGWFGPPSTMVLPSGNLYVPKATVMMLTVLLLVESTLVLIIRRINMPLSKSLREPGTYRYAIFLGLIYLAHLLLMYVPLTQQILDSYGLTFYFVPLSPVEWLICILFALPAIAGMELYKWSLRRKGIHL